MPRRWGRSPTLSGFGDREQIGRRIQRRTLITGNSVTLRGFPCRYLLTPGFWNILIHHESSNIYVERVNFARWSETSVVVQPRHTMAIARSLTLLLALCHSALGAATDKGSCGCKNSPERRDCWKQGFDINSDYEQVVPKGRLREVHIHCLFASSLEMAL